MRKLLWMSVVVGLACLTSSCAYLLPDTTPTMFGLLADRGDTRPFEKPLPMGRRHALLAATSYGTAVAIRESDGSLWTWGSDHLGDGLWSKEVDKPTKLEGTSGFIGVAAGSRHVLALRNDGTVWGWGDNKKGQLGFKEDGFIEGGGYDSVQLIPKQNPVLKDIVSIAAGPESRVALDSEGRVWVWGTSAKTIIAPRVLIQDRHIVSVKASVVGYQNIAVIMDDGKVLIWGGDKGFLEDKPSYKAGNGEGGIDGKIIDMAFDSGSYFALTRDGYIYSRGSNTAGDLGLGDFHDRQVFVRVPTFGRVVLLGWRYAIDEKGRLWRWGANVFLRMDLNNTLINKEPYPRVVHRQSGVLSAAEYQVNHNDLLFLDKSGKVTYLTGGDLTLLSTLKTNAWTLGD